jgi:two-component system response regulator YesN
MRRVDVRNEWFLRAVVDGDAQMDADMIDLFSRQLGILQGSSYFCVAARFVGTIGMAENAALPNTLKRCLLAAAKTVYDDDYYCYITDGLRAVLLLPDDGYDRTVAVNKLQSYLGRYSLYAVQLGVGRFKDMARLSHSKVEAMEALQSLGPSEGVAFIDDIYTMRSLTTRKLEGRKRQIVELFKAGQLEQMLDNMADLAEIVRAESPVREGTPYPTSIRRTILELLFEIMHISADAGVDVDAILGYEDPYAKVFALNGTPLILSWFREIAQKLYSGTCDASSRSQSNMLTKAMQCIEEHLSDPELGLSLVSDALSITPTYFSAFFIREVGVGFNEYITNLRIERAKTLLVHTNRRISDIAIECGFRSASYFNVVFRKQTGMSPKAFRNMK